MMGALDKNRAIGIRKLQFHVLYVSPRPPCPYSHAYLMRGRPPFLCGWTHTLPEDRQHQGAGSTNMIQVIHTMPPESESIKSRIRTVPLVYIRPQIHSSTATT